MRYRLPANANLERKITELLKAAGRKEPGHKPVICGNLDQGRAGEWTKVKFHFGELYQRRGPGGAVNQGGQAGGCY